MPNIVPAADIGLPHVMSRRTVPKSVAVASSLPGLALASPNPEDPVLVHHRVWTAHRAEWDRLSELPEHSDRKTPEVLAATDGWFSALEAMADTTPSGLDGIAALAQAFWAEFGPSSIEGTETWDEECEKTENRIIAQIWRAATGKEGVPPA